VSTYPWLDNLTMLCESFNCRDHITCIMETSHEPKIRKLMTSTLLPLATGTCCISCCGPMQSVSKPWDQHCNLWPGNYDGPKKNNQLFGKRLGVVEDAPSQKARFSCQEGWEYYLPKPEWELRSWTLYLLFCTRTMAQDLCSHRAINKSMEINLYTNSPIALTGLD
jgi:hypothetical protein